MSSYDDNGWKNYNRNPNDPYEKDNIDIGEQIRMSVAASTDWINDVISVVKGEGGRTRPKPNIKTPEELRAEAERQAQRQAEIAEKTRRREERKKRFGNVPKAGVGNVIAIVFGICLTLAFARSGIEDIIYEGFLDGAVDLALSLVFMVASLKYTVSSVQKRIDAKLFPQYLNIIGDKLYVDIDDIVNSRGYKKEKVLRDLRRMIRRGVLKQGHIDKEERYLIITDETYEQYLQARAGYESRADEEARKQEEEILSDIDKKKREELQTTLTQGRAYIKQIREANDELPGDIITGKLDKLETVAGQIFTIVEEHPEKLSEIHKFMEYYLPTTLKLLRNYKEFEMQPVQGENITSAKKEIEDTLDMINMAFANLSDRLYADVAMEVSADISVLHTLFAQEGLKQKDFQVK